MLQQLYGMICHMAAPGFSYTGAVLQNTSTTALLTILTGLGLRNANCVQLGPISHMLEVQKANA